jgi:hypothetical protein
MAHPHIPSSILLLPLHASKDRRNVAFASRGVLRMQFFPVATICHIDSFVFGDRVRVYGLSRRYTVLPFLLHLRMHNEE